MKQMSNLISRFVNNCVGEMVNNFMTSSKQTEKTLQANQEIRAVVFCFQVAAVKSY